MPILDYEASTGESLVASLTVSPSLPMNYYVVNVTIVDDDYPEEDESVGLDFVLYDEYEPSSSSNVIIANVVSAVLIVEDDDAPRKYSNEEIYSRYYTTT